MEKELKYKIGKYFKITDAALRKIKENINEGKEKEAEEIIEMVSNYFFDAQHFEKEGDFLNSFAALNYAHGWIDCGVRLGIFNVKDRDIFTVK